MSSLCASKRRRITSERDANQPHTSVNEYERPIRCFSPARIPGVSISVTWCSSGESSCAPWNFERKPLPNISSPRNGMFGDTASALPGVVLSSIPCITAMKRSVVGSGPMCCPGKSRPSRYRMNVVLPTEYCPSSSTIGFASKSPSVRSGE